MCNPVHIEANLALSSVKETIQFLGPFQVDEFIHIDILE